MSKNYFIGIDLGGTNIRIGMLDEQGNVIGSTSIKTQSELGPDRIMDNMAAGCETVIDQTNTPRDSIKALGIGSPGPLSTKRGVVIKAANLPGFIEYPIR